MRRKIPHHRAAAGHRQGHGRIPSTWAPAPTNAPRSPRSWRCCCSAFPAPWWTPRPATAARKPSPATSCKRRQGPPVGVPGDHDFYQRGAGAGAVRPLAVLDLHVDSVDLLQVHNLIDWQNNLRWLRQQKESRQDPQHRHHPLSGRLARHSGADPAAGKDGFPPDQLLGGRAQRRKTLLPAVRGQRGVAVLINRPFQDGRAVQRR